MHTKEIQHTIFKLFIYANSKGYFFKHAKDEFIFTRYNIK